MGLQLHAPLHIETRLGSHHTKLRNNQKTKEPEDPHCSETGRAVKEVAEFESAAAPESCTVTLYKNVHAHAVE